MMNITDTLAHYGIRGMKWGVRKRSIPKQGPSGDAREAHRAFVKAKVSGPQALTNNELIKVNNRLNLEQNFARLSYTPSKLKKGFDIATSLVKTGKTIDDARKFAQSDTGVDMAAMLGSSAARKTRTARIAAKKAASAAT